MPMIYPKSRDEWLALRWKFVSSTESSSLFGMNPYTTAFELAVLKSATEPPAQYEQNERMVWGTRLQLAIAKGIAEDYGVKVRAMNGYATIAHRMGASFDYEIIGLKDDFTPEDEGKNALRSLYKQHGPGVLEIKNVDGWIFRQEWHESSDEAIGFDVPEHIELQVQHQLHCVGRAWAALGVLVGGNRQVMVWRMRDEEVGEAIAGKCSAFWQNLDKGGMPPVELPRDASIIRKLYKYAEPGKFLEFENEAANADLAALARNLDALSKSKSALEKDADTVKAQILQLIGDAEKVKFPNVSISAGMVAPSEIEAYTRSGYRNLRVYISQPKEKKVKSK